MQARLLKLSKFNGPDIVTANYAQLWFRQFRFDDFDVKDAPRTGRPIDENFDKSSNPSWPSRWQQENRPGAEDGPQNSSKSGKLGM